MIRFAFAAVGLAVCFSSAMAQSDPIAERKTAMKAVGAATGLGTKIAKGEEVYDTAKVQGIFKVYIDAAKKVPTLFPNSSKTGGETTAPKKQAARMLKCECAACGYTVRTARKWLETVGAPLCPIEGHGPMHHDPLDSDRDDPEP